MPRPTKGDVRYIGGLDGLRAMAVIAVVVYHLNAGWAPGGLLGVGLFFVLSGYLITDLLLEQWRRDGRLDLKQFWMRRIRRLLPALIVMIAGVVVWVAAVSRTPIPSLQGDVVTALLYVNNWWYIFHEVSYFEKFGPASPLGHLWSLAVEEQFYLLWPVILYLLLRFVRRRGMMVGFILTAAFLSVLAMALLYEPGTDPSRVYYGTDTRAFALLIGGALAFVWPSGQLSASVSRRSALPLDIAGMLGLLVLLCMVWKTNDYDALLYRGGFVLQSLATALVIAAIAHPAGRLGKVIGCAPLRWLGVRSYGIYLWHYPVIVLSTVSTHGPSMPRMLLQVTVTLALAALSWRFIEEPIRHGALGTIWRKRTPGSMRSVAAKRWITSLGAIVVLAAFVFGFSNLAPNATASPIVAASSSVTRVTYGVDANVTSVTNAVYGVSGDGNESGVYPVFGTTTDVPPVQVVPSEPVAPSESDVKVAEEEGRGITAIGDSVMVDIAPYLSELLPGIVIDGKIGRQMSQAADVLEQLKKDRLLGDRVIIELGTNGAFSERQLNALLDSLPAARRIVLVNTRVPRPWESVVNAALAAAVADRENVTLIDWYTASADHESYFAPDGVHLEGEGARVYASLVAAVFD